MTRLVQPTPMYAQLRDILAERIASGELSPGARVPSERELCEQFSISKHTVIKALGELTTKGLIRRIQGRGTFVAGRRPRLGTLRFVFYRAAAEIPLDTYYAAVLGAAEACASGHGFDLAIASANSDFDPIAPGDAGCLMVGPVPDELIDRAAETKVPLVSVDHPACPFDVDIVAFDEVASGELAAKVLLSRGFKRIGYVGEGDWSSPDKREWPNSLLRLEG